MMNIWIWSGAHLNFSWGIPRCSGLSLGTLCLYSHSSKKPSRAEHTWSQSECVPPHGGASTANARNSTLLGAPRGVRHMEGLRTMEQHQRTVCLKLEAGMKRSLTSFKVLPTLNVGSKEALKIIGPQYLVSLEKLDKQRANVLQK